MLLRIYLVQISQMNSKSHIFKLLREAFNNECEHLDTHSSKMCGHLGWNRKSEWYFWQQEEHKMVW